MVMAADAVDVAHNSKRTQMFAIKPETHSIKVVFCYIDMSMTARVRKNTDSEYNNDILKNIKYILYTYT